MGLIDRITALWRKITTPEREQTTTTERREPSRSTAWIKRFQADVERRQMVEACRAMYRQDPRARKMIRTLARDIVGSGFEIEVGDEQAAEIASELVRRLEVPSRLDDWIRLTMRDGDTFLEIGVNERKEIADITRKPTLQMHRASDETDRFPDPERAFWWADELWGGQEAPSDAVWFAEWQIVHARWDHDENSRYGTPMFASAVSAWKRATEGENDIAIRRKTRAGMKYLHVVEGASPAELEAYKELNREALDNPFAAVADFFVNRPGAIQVIQGDPQLGEIADIEHHIATWLMAGDVPMELLGYGENLNRDVLEEKKKEYDETLAGLRLWAETEFLRPLLERQWLLLGIWPGGLSYSIKWKIKQPLTAANIRDIADAALKLRALGLQDEALWQLLGQFLPGVDISALIEQPGIQQEGAPQTVAKALAALRGSED